jgi:hypothetical protein
MSFLNGGVNMALIKCPECGNEVSSIADTCPKCGYPVKKYLNFISQEIIENKDEFPEPISDEWVQKFYRIKKENCVFCFVCFMIFFVAFIILLTLDVLSLLFITTIIMAFFACVFGYSLFAKIRIRKEDGYTILVYSFFKRYLYIEDELVDSSLTNRTLYGELPNKKRVIVTFALEDGSVRIGIDGKGNDTQLL